DTVHGTWNWSGTGDDSTPYTVTITAANVNHTTATTSFNVSFIPLPPTASLGAPTGSPVEGSTISLTGSATSFSAEDAAAGYAFAWSGPKLNDGVTTNNFAQGTATGSGVAIGFIPDDDGIYTVRLTAT